MVLFGLEVWIEIVVVVLFTFMFGFQVWLIFVAWLNIFS